MCERSFSQRCALVAMTLAFIPPLAHAGLVKITGAEPGTTATVYVNAVGYSPFNTSQTIPASGSVTFTIDKDLQNNATRVQKRYVPHSQAPASVLVGADFVQGSLPALEPFQMPVFLPQPLLVAPGESQVNIDANALLASGMTFNVGNNYNVTNGTVAGLPFVSIPGFTGTASIVGFDSFAPLPEPVVALLVCLGVWIDRRQRHANGSRGTP